MVPNVLFLCLCGLAISILALVSCQNCRAVQPFPVYVNVSGNATFHVQANESHFYHSIYVNRHQGRFRIISAIQFPLDRNWSNVHVWPYDNRYDDRVTVAVTVTAGLWNINLTIADIQLDDSGTYMIQKGFPWDNGTCFILYISGIPEVNMSVSPNVVQEGNSGHFKCLATSATVPTSHNLTMFILWYIDGRYIETGKRYRVDNNMLAMYSMTRADDGLVVTCEAREEKGLTTVSNISVIIYWGPDRELILQPTRTFYHIDDGKTLPSIKCSTNCKPVCKISWTKAENGSIVSPNGLLSLGPAKEENSGEYVCTATREGTYKEASKSIFILLKEKKENGSQAMAAIGIGLSVVTLLLAVVVVIFLFRQMLCSWKCRRETGGPKESTSKDQTSQNRAYEDLKGTRAVQETYDALALGTFEDSSTHDQETKNANLYENNRLSA